LPAIGERHASEILIETVQPAPIGWNVARTTTGSFFGRTEPTTCDPRLAMTIETCSLVKVNC
jgi:hypothetical protein